LLRVYRLRFAGSWAGLPFEPDLLIYAKKPSNGSVRGKGSALALRRICVAILCFGWPGSPYPQRQRLSRDST